MSSGAVVLTKQIVVCCGSPVLQAASPAAVLMLLER